MDCDDQDPSDLDADDDGVCDVDDLCEGDDSYGDADGDGLCQVGIIVGEVEIGLPMDIAASNVREGAEVYFMASTVQQDDARCFPAFDVCVGLAGFRIIGSTTYTGGPSASVTLTVPNTLVNGTEVFFQAIWIDRATMQAEVSDIESSFVGD